MTSEPPGSTGSIGLGGSAGVAAREGTDPAAGESATRGALVYRVEVAPHGCFVCGDLNDQGLHVALRVSEGRAWTELTLTAHHEGWSGVVHGGILAALLDEMMGWALFHQESWGVTAELAVRFRRPVLVGQRIRVEGWITDGRRRATHAAGRILDATTGRLLCTADGTYVAAGAAQRATLQARYRLRLVPVADPPAAPPPQPRLAVGTVGRPASRPV